MTHLSQYLFQLTPTRLLDGLAVENTPAPIKGALWYRAQTEGEGAIYFLPKGALAAARYLCADFLLDGQHLAVFKLTLQEGENGPVFGYSFGLLNQCSARLRLPLEAVNQNRWRYEREGALLKPRCEGERVDLRRVDRMQITVQHKGPLPVRWCMTPIAATSQEPPELTELALPQGALIDELGQSRLHDWPTKSRSTEEVTRRLFSQSDAADQQSLPEDFSPWGGWQNQQVEASGFFRTYHDGRRWWLVDPEGYLFWSSGPDCVRVDAEAAYRGLESALEWLPDPTGEYQAAYHTGGEMQSVNYLAANFIRAFGADAWYERWATITLSELRRIGFNSVGNWSDWRIASQASMPYVRPLDPDYGDLPRVYRDFPDVFHPDFKAVCAAFAEPLRETRADPALIGYFLMNEPTWGFAQETPAVGMLYNTPTCYTRRALADFLRLKYGRDAALAEAWKLPTTFEAVAEGDWRAPLNAQARADLADFSEGMAATLFDGLSAACRVVDPNHLNLGIRYYTVPPAWALKGMRQFDVFSMNCYRPRLPAEEMSQISAMLNLPILIGEWHFGALDVGLPASGIGHVPNQKGRGQAYRVYLEDAAAQPWCVGVHYFTLYDQSALGRFDGEAYNIGFLDICNRPYGAVCQAARASHEVMYAVAAGETPPYDEAPEYLPLLFM